MNIQPLTPHPDCLAMALTVTYRTQVLGLVNFPAGTKILEYKVIVDGKGTFDLGLIVVFADTRSRDAFRAEAERS